MTASPGVSIGSGLDLLAGKRRETGDDHCTRVTSDGPDGRPWRPTESNLWHALTASPSGAQSSLL